MIPQASLDVDAIPSAQAFVDRVSDVAWDGLKDSFPTPDTGISSEGEIIPGLDLPTRDGEQIWVDGEALKYLLGSIRQVADERFAPLLDHLQGLKLTRQGDALNAGIYFDQPMPVSIRDEKKAPRWQPYSLRLPKTVRFSIRMIAGRLVISGLDQGLDTATLKLKMPFLPDTVWMKSASVDMGSGHVRVEAGVVGDWVTVVANADLIARKFGGVDIWESIKRNLTPFEWPTLTFAVE
jgi:hypothetical protein